MNRSLLLSPIVPALSAALLALAPIAASAEPLLRQNFDQFPEQIEIVHKPADPFGGNWWGGFGKPEVHTTVQSERARQGKAIRMQRAMGEPAQALHSYFTPSSHSRIIMKFALYFEGEGGVRVGMDNHEHRLFDVLLSTSGIEYYDTALSKWQQVPTPAHAVADSWMEWTIECDRAAGTFSIALKHDHESAATVVADDLPLNAQAEAMQKVLEFRVDPGGPYYVDDVSVDGE